MKFLKSITDDQTKALIAAGYSTVDDLKHATKQDLASIEGIDAKLARAILKESASFRHRLARGVVAHQGLGIDLHQGLEIGDGFIVFLLFGIESPQEEVGPPGSWE
jgi:bacterioferritin-associated ferredoxin